MPQLTVKLLLGLLAYAAGIEQHQMGLRQILSQLIIRLLEQASDALRVVFVHLATVCYDRQLLRGHVDNSSVMSPAVSTPCWRKKACWSSSRSSTAAPRRSSPATRAGGSPGRQNSAAARRVRGIEQSRKSAPMNNTPSRSASLRSAPRRSLPTSVQFLSCTPAICAPRKWT